MIIAFITVIGLLYSINFFNLNIRLIPLNRHVINIPKEIFESSIPVITNNTFVAYFDNETLKTKLTSYFDKSISEYVDEYHYKLFFYRGSQHSLCPINHCNGVEIEFHATVASYYHYTRTLYYEIQKNQ